MLYDILLFNNSTKKGYLFQAQEDMSSTNLYHSFPNMDFSALTNGEYTSYVVRNEYGTAVTWDIQDVPLDSVLTYDGKQYKLMDLLPEITLVKFGADSIQDKSDYRNKDVQYFYRKRN